MTVATATSRPARLHASASFRMSLSVESMFYLCFGIRQACSSTKHRRSAGLFQPAGRVCGGIAFGREGADQPLHRAEIMDRAELVDERQHGANAGRARLEAAEAEQRVQPH